MRTALIVIASLVAIVGVLWFATQYERATLYKCTACFMDNPSKCATHTDNADDWSSDEGDARIAARIKLCELGNEANAAAYEECHKLPPDHFKLACTSWRQWAAKPASSPFSVH